MKTKGKVLTMAEVFMVGQVWVSARGRVLIVGIDRPLNMAYVAGVSEDSLGDAQFTEPGGRTVAVDVSLLALSFDDLERYEYTVDDSVIDVYKEQMSSLVGLFTAINHEKPVAEPVEDLPAPVITAKPERKTMQPKLAQHTGNGYGYKPYTYPDGRVVSFDQLREQATARGGTISQGEAEYLARTYLGHTPILPNQSATGRRSWDFASASDFMRVYSFLGVKVCGRIWWAGADDNRTLKQVPPAYAHVRDSFVGEKVMAEYKDIAFF